MAQFLKRLQAVFASALLLLLILPAHGGVMQKLAQGAEAVQPVQPAPQSRSAQPASLPQRAQPVQAPAAQRSQSTQPTQPTLQSAQDPKCLQPVEPGPCRMSLDRFYYNAQTNSCQLFKFGGCRGNDNKFGFVKTCEDACLRTRAPAASKTAGIK